MSRMKSPSGVVHGLFWTQNMMLRMCCGVDSSYPAPWALSQEPVTCKRCLDTMSGKEYAEAIQRLSTGDMTDAKRT